MMSSPKIQVRGLTKSFDRHPVLQGIDFDLQAKESLVIIGASGTGKSVLIKCILGLLKPDQGKILINGEDVTGQSLISHQSLSRFGMLFQGGALFDSMTVWENVAFGLIQGKRISEEEAREIAFAKLAAVNLNPGKIADIFPAELSGGMQKRVALARAIATDPEVIFFDEPTTGLDPITGGTINELIVQCVHSLGASALTITHDINSLRHIANRVGLLHKGKILWTGTVEEMDKTDNPYVVQFIHGYSEGPFTADQDNNRP